MCWCLFFLFTCNRKQSFRKERGGPATDRFLSSFSFFLFFSFFLKSFGIKGFLKSLSTAKDVPHSPGKMAPQPPCPLAPQLRSQHSPLLPQAKFLFLALLCRSRLLRGHVLGVRPSQWLEFSSLYESQ